MEKFKTEEIKNFTEYDARNYMVEKFKFCAREMQAYESEMIQLCTDMVSDFGMSMEQAIDLTKSVDLTEQDITD